MNDFYPGWDLSNLNVVVKRWWKNENFHVFDFYDSDIEIIGIGEKYRTNVYGLRIGWNRLIVDFRYLTIDNLMTRVYTLDYGAVYENYEYPFKFNGFPSATIFYGGREESFFLQFNSLNFIYKLHPLIPEFGWIKQTRWGTSFIIIINPPYGISMIGRIINW